MEKDVVDNMRRMRLRLQVICCAVEDLGSIPSLTRCDWLAVNLIPQNRVPTAQRRVQGNLPPNLAVSAAAFSGFLPFILRSPPLVRYDVKPYPPRSTFPRFTRELNLPFLYTT